MIQEEYVNLIQRNQELMNRAFGCLQENNYRDYLTYSNLALGSLEAFNLELRKNLENLEQEEENVSVVQELDGEEGVREIREESSREISNSEEL